MKTVLFRTGSGPVRVRSSAVRSIPRSCISRSCSISGDGDFKAMPIKFELNRSRSETSGRKNTFPARFSGDGIGNGSNSGGGRGGGGGEDRVGLGEYYGTMLKAYPGDPLLLRNYAKYLDEVVGDSEKAGEYYARAILASHGDDGEVLALYGKLIWDTERDEERAKYYFDKAVSASPNDCNVWGSYANFMWESEEDDDETEVNMSCHASLVV